jgi:zinc and cadmium transporter
VFWVWVYSLVSVVLVSLISLIGALTISLRPETLKKALLLLVGFSVGGLFGGAFIHLLPEAVEGIGFSINLSLYVLSGILFFYVMEMLIHWRHCHIPTSSSHPHPFAYMNLIGDGIHNLIDGMIIWAGFLAGIPLGIATTVAVILHEIPQEIGDFGILVHGGFGIRRALMMNFLTALTAVAGVAAAIILGGMIEGLGMFLLPFAAGGFIYIAGSDLIPELHKQCSSRKSLAQLMMIVLGILVMLSLVLMG